MVFANLEKVDGGKFLALFIDELVGSEALEATPVFAKVLFEEEGYAGSTHGHAKYERAGDQVENHPNVLE